MSKIGKIVVFGVVAFAVIAISIPNLLSTTYVKQRIASQLSELTGRSVSLNGSSSVSLRPYLGVSYRDVTISDERDEKGAPLVSMEGFQARLGLLAAFWGDAQLTELEFIRPQFNLHIRPDGTKNWMPDKGLLGLSMKADSQGNFQNVDLGTVKITDGKLNLNDESNRTTRELSSINASAEWPDTGSEAKLELSAVWQGEVFEITFYSDALRSLLMGDDSNLAVKFSSKPLTFNFDGEVKQFFEEASGTVEISSASPNRLAGWLNWRKAAIYQLGSLAINGEAIFRGNTLEFPDAALSQGEHIGKGRLQIGFQNREPASLNGTLAFDTLSFPEFNITRKEETANALSSPVTTGLNFGDVVTDIRLSAQTATSGKLELIDLAAALLIRDNTASFDIGQAQVFEGTVAGSLSLSTNSTSYETSANVTFSDIELAQLAQYYGETSLSLSGKGNVALKLKADTKEFVGLIERINGEGSIISENGAVTGLDLAGIYEDGLSGLESFASNSDSTTSFDTLKLNFFVANGTAFVRDSGMENDDLTLTMSGRADLAKSSIAIRGNILSKSEDIAKQQILPFFVGGTAASPLFVPLPSRVGQPSPTQSKKNSKIDAVSDEAND